MKLPEVTEETLSKRKFDRSQFEIKHGICPLGKADIEAIRNSQKPDDDELCSYILASKCKTSKRSIPAHETLSKVTSSELGLSIAKALNKFTVYNLMSLEFFFPGDSICSALLFSQHEQVVGAN